MPVGLQYLAALSPLRYYMEAVLAIFLKGVGLKMLWPQLAGLGAIGASLLAISMVRWRRHIGY